MKEKINILVLGSGGRESAICRQLSLSPRTSRLYAAPGNGGSYAENVKLNPCDFEAVEEFAKEAEIDMIVVGPEQPLVEGVYDYFKEKGSPIKVIGPSKKGAALEGSKEFAKEFMSRHGIPTARFMTVDESTLDEGYAFLESLKPPYVLKADGLAAGKGVLIINSLAEAKDSLQEMIKGMFGSASSTVVIEEYLDGIECSVFVVTDGEEYKILPVAKDYKRVGEGDKGLNTGGMGAVSPVWFADDEFIKKVEQQIVVPTLRGIQEEELDYRGFIFLGLMRSAEGEPSVIEYNVRMGDPETEVVIPRLKSDLVDLLEGVADCTLALKPLEVDERTAVTVMLVSGGYPEAYEKGKEITGLETVAAEGIVPFVAGAVKDSEGRLLTSGGRVIALTAFGKDVAEAAAKAEAAADKVTFEGAYHRRDIGQDVMNH